MILEDIIAMQRKLDAIPKPAFHTIKASALMVDRVEDWSMVRSPSRAKRRMKRGKRFRQNVMVTVTPKKEAVVIEGVAYVHPSVYMRLEAEWRRDNALQRGAIGIFAVRSPFA